MMDAITDPNTREITLQTSSQVGKTEVLLNTIGFFVDHDPAPMLIVLPTESDAEAWSKDRLTPMFRDTPCLGDKLDMRKSRDSENTISHKKFPGGHITLVGANAPSGLAMRPIRVLLFDEVDRFPRSAGTEGDPISIARKRTATFWNSVEIKVSSPTIAGKSRIEAAFEESDKRYFLVPCHDCGEYQRLVWKNVRWDKSKAGEHSPETARYECEACGAQWTEAQRLEAIGAGRWEATAEFNGHAGFHLSEIYSPWRSLADMAAAFLEAKRGGNDQLKTFVNTSLGETWSEPGDAPEWEIVAGLAEQWPADRVPREAAILTCGIDVQRDWIHADVWGWSQDLQSWLVDHKVFYGGPGSPECWNDLTRYVTGMWAREGGGEIGLAKVCIDSGYDPQSVYLWARTLGWSLVSPVKGRDSLAATTPVAGPSFVELSIKGRKYKRGARLWTVATAQIKAETYRAIRQDRPAPEEVAAGAGFAGLTLHVPQWASTEWIKGLVSEQLVTTKDRRGYEKHEWNKTRERNEPLDARTYARAATWILGCHRWSQSKWDEHAAAHPVQAADRAQPVEPRQQTAPKVKGWF